MPRNTEGLKRSARVRSESAMQRALVALQRMEASDREVNFRTVATQAGVSTAWLYGRWELRDRIMRLRKSQTWEPSAKSATADSGDLSRKSIIATLRLRIKNLEEKNRELAERLEHAYGFVVATGTTRSPDRSPVKSSGLNTGSSP